MEGILALIAVVIGIAFIRFLLGAGVKTVQSAGRTLTGKGTFSENMELAFNGMGPMEARFTDEKMDGKPDGTLIKKVEVKGLFPLSVGKRVGFVTSVFDETSGEFQAVISAIDGFQEEKSRVYQSRLEVGEVNPSQGFVSWVRAGVVIPDVLVTPYSGERKLAVILRLIDLDNPPAIEHGFHAPESKGILWQKRLNFTHSIKDKGYREAAEHREEAQAIALKLGVFVAVRNGRISDPKGNAIKGWVTKQLDLLASDQRESKKGLYNAAMKEAFAAAAANELSLSELTTRLNEIADKPVKYDAIDLCFDVATSAGGADGADLRTIRKIAEAIDLDLKEIDKIRDQKIVSLGGDISKQGSIEELLGVGAEWDKDRIKKHLRDEFQKWNNRLSTLPDGEERQSAQTMLDLISQARKKYG